MILTQCMHGDFPLVHIQNFWILQALQNLLIYRYIDKAMAIFLAEPSHLFVILAIRNLYFSL